MPSMHRAWYITGAHGMLTSLNVFFTFERKKKLDTFAALSHSLPVTPFEAKFQSDFLPLGISSVAFLCVQVLSLGKVFM